MAQAALPVPHALHWIRALSASVQAVKPKKVTDAPFVGLQVF